MWNRTHRTSYVYVAAEFLLSFLVAFLFFFFIFFVNQLLLLAEDILAKDVPFFDVLRLILYSLPSIVALSFPFGALVGALMAVGRMSADNEIIAFRASGVPPRVLFLPIAVVGLAFSMVSFVMNDYFLPVGTIKFGTLYRDLLYTNPRLELEPHSVIRYRDSTLITGNVDEEGIENLIILEGPGTSGRRVITAERAGLRDSGPDRGVLSLELEDVFSQRSRSREEGGYEHFTATSMVYNVLLRDITHSVRTPGPREMSSVDVYDEIRRKRADLEERRHAQTASLARMRMSLYRDYLSASGADGYEATASGRDGGEGGRVHLEELQSSLEAFRREAERDIHDRSLQIYRIEFHKKFAIPFACLAFTVFAFPVGLLTRRSGRSVGFAVGLLVAVLYWAMLIAGQTLGTQRLTFSAVLAMWGPNLLVLVLGAGAFFVRRQR
ncbi:MAG: LptF/LptG family permease [Spirochaetaceae bacterium]